MDGDFNIAMDKNVDSMNYKNFKNNPKAWSTLIHQMKSLNSSDIFRCAKPQLKRFTWREKSNQISKTRFFSHVSM